MNGEVYESKYGPYIITGEYYMKGGQKYVKVHFLNTGYEYFIRQYLAKRGEVSDKTLPQIFPKKLPKNQRVYSRNTCMFLSIRDNRNLSAIERKQNSTIENKYFGVIKVGDNFVMNISVAGMKRQLRFSDEIAAANAFNYWFDYYHAYDLIRLTNHVPYMPPEEFCKYMITNKTMCKIVD